MATQTGKVKLALTKPFVTIWAPMPPESLLSLKPALQTLADCCEVVAGDGTRGWYTPHITLRYLGYSSPELEAKILREESKFSEIVISYLPLRVRVRGFTLFEDGAGQLRLSWNIVDETSLAKLHTALLSIPGYSGFPDLEGINYHPHIILAKADMKVPATRERLNTFIQSFNSMQAVEFLVSLAEINFVGPSRPNGLPNFTRHLRLN